MVKRLKGVTSVGLVALGCSKNQVDAETILAQLTQAGLTIVSDPTQADAVIVHTCGFIRPAVEESLGVIRQMVRLKRTATIKKVIVSGCLVQRMGQSLGARVPGIDALVDLNHRDVISQIVRHTMARDTARSYIGSESTCTYPPDDSVRLLIGPRHTAYLRVSEGCSHRCSFCTIPAIRGPHRSKTLQTVLDEAHRLADSGVVELNVIGQDITSYLRDQGVRHGLVRLIEGLEQVRDLRWVRLLYLYPAGISDLLLRTIAASNKTVHYLDIPIQHAHTEILRAMRRPDTHSSLMDLVERIRRYLPQAVLRTTVIVGFPGERRAHFHYLFRFIRWARFDALGCFPFYPEAGTPAARMSGQVPQAVKQRRLHLVMTAQQAIAFEKNRARIGSGMTCLIDRVRTKQTRLGRFYGQAPQIDSVCIVRGCTERPGRFIDVKVVGTRGYDLVTEPVSP